MLHSHVSLGLVCHSCIYRGLWIDLILLCILLLIFNPLWREGVIGSSFSVSHSFPRLGFARVWVLSFFNSAPAFFVGRLILLSCRPIASAMLSFDLCLLGLLWTYRTLSFYLFHVAQYFCWTCSHTILGFLGPFHPFGASSTHFISLGFLDLFHYYIPMGFC